jgi:hypothetical protein
MPSVALQRAWSKGWRFGADGREYIDRPLLDTDVEIEAWEDGLIVGRDYRRDPSTLTSVATNPYKPENMFRLNAEGFVVPTGFPE